LTNNSSIAVVDIVPAARFIVISLTTISINSVVLEPL
jgi:hypothetical protein